MRILITCDRYPGQPLDGLTLRIFHYVRHLACRHEFDLMCLDDNSPSYPDIERHFQVITRVAQPVKSRPGNFFARVATGLDPATLYPRSTAAQEALASLAAQRNYDLVWDAGCNTLFNLGNLRHEVPLLADQVDDSFASLRRSLRLASGFYRRIWIAKQVMLQYFFARRYLKPADAVLFVSQTDADSFRRLIPGSKTYVIENGVDELYYKPTAAAETGAAPQLVLEGSMSFRPNIDAATYFVGEILPLIRKAIPDVRFTIVGRNPSDEVKALAGAGVQVTGSVPDIRPYLACATVFVCPMRVGTGIKNKILQAWAMGLPVVSTNSGAGGLRYRDGENILIRNGPHDFAQGVVTLLRDRGSAARLGAAARATIERHYTWAAKADELEALMKDIVQRHRERKSQ